MTKSRDKIYASKLNAIEGFSFDAKVAAVFSDMLERSVPGYATTIANIGVLAEHYVQDNSHCYDLGCSLGAATLAMLHSIKSNNCKVFAVDNSQAMLDRCQEYLVKGKTAIPVELVNADINDIEIFKASLVILNFTLQFVSPEMRLGLLKKIYAGMLEGGVLVLSEKINFNENDKNSLLTDLHHDFKRANGYSDLEISQKRNALENVLIADSMDEHIARLNEAGFKRVYQWFQCFNFVSVIAIK